MERAALGVGVVPLLLELHVLHLVADDCGSTRNSPSTVDRARGEATGSGSRLGLGTAQFYLVHKGMYIPKNTEKGIYIGVNILSRRRPPA